MAWNPFNRGTRSQTSIDATTRSGDALSDDLLSTVPPSTGTDTTAGLAALAGRASATARARTKRLVKKLLRSSVRAARAEDRRVQRHAARAAHLAKKGVINRHGLALEHVTRRTMIGYVGTWVSAVIIIGVPLVMVLNDPLFVLMTLRRIMDVPESAPLLDFNNLNTLVAVAAAVGLTILLIFAAVTAGRSLSQLLFRKFHLSQAGHVEVRHSKKVLPAQTLLIFLGLSLAILVPSIVFLHGIAEARFTGGAASAFQAEADKSAGTLLTWFITLLPVAVLVVEFVAAHPTLEHNRKAAHAAIRFRTLEWFDLNRDDRAFRRVRRLRNKANTWHVELGEMIADVALRISQDIVTASRDTGLISAAPVAGVLGVTSALEAPKADAAPASATAQPDEAFVSYTGRINVGDIHTDVVSVRAQAALSAHARLRTSGSVREVWHEARENAIEHAATAKAAAIATEAADAAAEVNIQPSNKEQS